MEVAPSRGRNCWSSWRSNLAQPKLSEKSRSMELQIRNSPVRPVILRVGFLGNPKNTMFFRRFKDYILYQVVFWGKHIDFLKKACQELLGIILVKRSDLRLIKLLHVDEVAKHSPRFQNRKL